MQQALQQGHRAAGAPCGAAGRRSGSGRKGPFGGAAAPALLQQRTRHESSSGCRRVSAGCSSGSGDGAAGWGGEQQARPDACHAGEVDQDRAAGPLGSLDIEWQAFIAGKARYQQPQPLVWDADSRPGSSGGGGSSGWPSTGGGGAASGVTSSSSGNRGPEASTSSGSVTGSSQRYSSSIQSFDDWDALEDELAAIPVTSALSEAALQKGATAPPPASSSIPSGLSSTADALWAAAVAHAREQLAAASAAASSAAASASASSAASPAAPADALGNRGLWQHLGEVYVLLFGVGQKDTEGIYSLRAVSDDGLPTETIIAFENMEDAVRYAALLEATMEHSPHVCSIPPGELMAFCSDSGYRCRLELEGSMLMPPDYNVHVTDWERSLRLREGKFHVLPEEPDVLPGSSAAASAASPAPTSSGLFTGAPASSAAAAAPPASAVGLEGVYSPWVQSPQSAGGYTVAQLDALKAQLESLLPATPSLEDVEAATQPPAEQEGEDDGPGGNAAA